MKKLYKKPTIEVVEGDFKTSIMSGSLFGGGDDAGVGNPEGKRREYWVEEIDLWGNESWTKVDME